MKDLLRRYPEVAEAALAAVAAISPADVEEPEARAAFVWILGHHGGHIQVRLPAAGGSVAIHPLPLSTNLLPRRWCGGCARVMRCLLLPSLAADQAGDASS